MIELNCLVRAFHSAFVVSQDRKALELLITRIELSESNPIIPDLPVSVNHEIVALSRHQKQTSNLERPHVTNFSRDNREVMIFDLHDERTNVEACVDDSEAISLVAFDVKDCQRGERRGVRGLLEK